MITVVVTNENVPCWSSSFEDSKSAEEFFFKLVEYYDSTESFTDEEKDDIAMDGFYLCEGGFIVSIVHPIPSSEFDFDAVADDEEEDEEIEVEYEFREKVIEYRRTRIMMPKSVVDQGNEAMVDWIHDNYDGSEEESLEHSDTIESLLDVTIESY